MSDNGGRHINRKKLGEFLRHARESCSLNQTQLAEQIGYSIDSVSRWEQGKQAITVEALVSILEVTHLQIMVGDKEAKACIKIL